jgi:ribosome-interacting GTPase 1
VQWNEQQKRKQDQIDALKAQLAEGRQQLEQMQEAARKQGYGSAVYDP